MSTRLVPEARNSRSSLELSCCLQDPGGWAPGAKSLRRNALGQKLSCCWQDRAAAVSGPEHVVAGGSALRRPGAAHDTAASNLDAASATSAHCRGTLGHTPGPRRSSDGDTPRDGGAGSRGCRTPTDPADISMIGRTALRSGIAVRPYGGCRILRSEIVRRDLETAVECVLHSGRWLFSAASKPPEMLSFYPAINNFNPGADTRGQNGLRSRRCDPLVTSPSGSPPARSSARNRSVSNRCFKTPSAPTCALA